MEQVPWFLIPLMILVVVAEIVLFICFGNIKHVIRVFVYIASILCVSIIDIVYVFILSENIRQYVMFSSHMMFFVSYILYYHIQFVRWYNHQNGYFNCFYCSCYRAVSLILFVILFIMYVVMGLWCMVIII